VHDEGLERPGQMDFANTVDGHGSILLVSVFPH
jgi:hypothetical protein